MTENNSYKESLKATSLFGGVQIFNILIQIIRSKFVAILLGPEGMGITGLLNSTITLISSFTNCGLSSSAVRNIAEANISDDKTKVSTVITILRKLVWVTGLVGTLLCFIFASYWSKMTFGNTEYTYAFMILSLSILFMQLTVGQNTLLQGLQKYSFLAKSNVLGNSIGLVITVPLYYFWKIDAIVPVLLLANFTSFLLALYFSHKVKIKSINVSKNDLKREGSNMVKMGILISMQGLLSTLSSYLIRIYITRSGSIDDVGLFNAGFTIINTYVGLVFTAMATDYYPRLSKVAKQTEEFNKTINNQAEIAILLLAPIIIIFIVFAKWAVMLLYSSKFLPAEGMIYWAISAILIKAMAWSLSYSLLAKGNSRLFFWSEFFAIVYGFLLNVIGYHYFGLTGLGVSFFIKYILYFIQLRIVSGIFFGFRFNNALIKIFIVFSIAILLCMGIKFFTSSFFNIILGLIILIFISYYSFVELDKRVAIKKYIYNKFNRK